MNLLNLCASFGASTFAVCMGGLFVMLAATCLVTVVKCFRGAVQLIRH